jgi:hypothetical protein
MQVMVSSGLVVEPREQVLVERDAFVLVAVDGVVVLGLDGGAELEWLRRGGTGCGGCSCR